MLVPNDQNGGECTEQRQYLSKVVGSLLPQADTYASAIPPTAPALPFQPFKVQGIASAEHTPIGKPGV